MSAGQCPVRSDSMQCPIWQSSPLLWSVILFNDREVGIISVQERFVHGVGAAPKAERRALPLR